MIAPVVAGSGVAAAAAAAAAVAVAPVLSCHPSCSAFRRRLSGNVVADVAVEAPTR